MPTQNHDPRLIGECSTWLSIVGQLFSVRMGKLLEPFGITQGQFSILHHITQPRISGGSRISDIAAAVEVGQPAVTKAVAKFENLGLVSLSNSQSDKRTKIVTALPAAQVLLTDIRMALGPNLGPVFGGLDPSELQNLTKTLRNLGVWLDNNRL